MEQSPAVTVCRYYRIVDILCGFKLISIRLIYDCCCTVLWTHGIIILRPRAFNLKSKYERQKPKNCLLAPDHRSYVSTSLSLYPVDRAFSYKGKKKLSDLCWKKGHAVVVASTEVNVQISFVCDGK